MIELQQVSLKRDETQILIDINLRLEAGQHWVLLGRNGSGKTSLLEIVNGYMFPSSGIVSVFGERYGQTDLRELRKRIGYVSQSLFEKLSPNDSVWEAVASGEYAYLRFYEEIPASLKAKAVDRLEQVGMERLKDHTLGSLSQGERKKAMLARALMLNPELLIMDEPCSGLDLYERERLLEVIERMGEDSRRTIVYVTHHTEEIIPLFTHVAILEQGRLIDSGRKEDVLTSEALFRAYHVHTEIEWAFGRPWVKVGSAPTV